MLTPDEVLRETASSGLDDAASWKDHTAPEDCYAHLATELARQLLDAREALRGWVGTCPACTGNPMVRNHTETCRRTHACLPEHQEFKA